MKYIISFRKPCGIDNEDKSIYKDILLIIGIIFIALGSICLYNWINNDPYNIGISIIKPSAFALLIGGALVVLFSFIKIKRVNIHYYKISQPFLL